MAKYIDADKLIKAIEEKGLDCSFALKMERLDTLALIDSLQQEQRETDGDDRKFVKILVRKELAEQIQKLGDEILAGQSYFIVAMNQQEQPEVDLEKELDRYIRGEFKQTAGGNFNNYIQVARHFYELGQKDAANKYDEIEYNRQRAEEENK